MIRLYKRIWADALFSEKGKRTEGENWKLYTLIPISGLMGLNLFTLFYWMKLIFNHNLPLFFELHIFAYNTLNSFIGIMITLFLPFVILNYLVIFSNDRYKKIINPGMANSGKTYRNYALFSIGILAIPFLISVLFF